MGKSGLTRRMDANEALAVSRMLRVSPQKLNLVAAMVRGKPVEEAITILKFSRKRIARDVLKTLNSAIANADYNYNLDVDALVVKEAFVGKNLVMKRFRPRARGRAGRINKPFAQVTIVVREMNEAS